MTSSKRFWPLFAALAVLVLGVRFLPGFAQQTEKKASSYTTVVEDKLDDVIARMTAEKPNIRKRHMDLLEERYEMGDHPAKGTAMSRGKPIQEGVRVKMPAGTTWTSRFGSIRERSLTSPRLRLRASWESGPAMPARP